ncbi:MAG: DUF2207 domain-containing protein [Dehalococcoidales bacterium]|nr:MAG: DUF2207 domain-containing protein [Dehalococcoidales bacterium]
MLHKNSWLAAFCLLLIAVPTLALCLQVQAAEEEITSFDSLHIDINILSNSDMEITETQKYSFLSGTFHYGYRWIPLDGVDSIDGVQVYEDGSPYLRNPAVKQWIDNYQKTGESPAGNYYAYHTWTEDNNLWIGWWYPETTGGSRVFEVTYVVHGGLRFFDDGDQLNWMAIFGDRDTAIGQATVTVHLPEPVSSTQLFIDSHGVAAEISIIDDRTIEFTTGSVPDNEELGIRVVLPKGIVDTTPFALREPEGVGEWITQTIETARQWIEYNPLAMRVINWCLIGLGITLILGGSFWLLAIQRRRAAEPIIYPPSSYLTTPPDDLPPALVGKLINGAYGFLGDIFYLAQQGFITITERVEKRWYGQKRDFLLERCEKTPPYGYQSHLMDLLFHGEPRLYLSENRQVWRKTAERTQEALDLDGIRLGLLQKVDREIIRTTGRWASHLGRIGFVCSLLGIVILALSIVIQAGGAALFVGGITLAFGVASWHLNRVPARVKRTEKGALVATQWQAYRYYLWLTARERLILTRGADHLDRDLPYAVRFGLGKKLVRALTTMGRPAPVPHWYNPHLMPEEDARSGGEELSLLDIRRGFYKLLGEVRRALPAMAQVGPAIMVASSEAEVDEAAESQSKDDD